MLLQHSVRTPAGETNPLTSLLARIMQKKKKNCKPRPDLQAKNIEAVWIESKIYQENFLIRSFYRNPQPPVEHWNLIKESIDNVDRTQTKFIILGDINDNVLPHPSSKMNNILNT